MVTGRQIRAAIYLLGWNLKRVSERSGVPWATVQRMQADDGVPRQMYEKVAAVQQALEDAGVEFIEDRGVALKKDWHDA
ncbi:XRE family transcriptional regulator [Azospirillum sp. TSA2s]|nr:XRE family transcriptional regulator [Azospirillum sp. TSA2s]